VEQPDLPARVEGEGDKPARTPRSSTDARVRPTRDRAGSAVVCARCRRPITTTGDRIEVDGLHEHTQINPHGFIWSFGCFASAPGCVPVGPPSREFAWFAGHTWQVADCGGCRLHLGWLFSSPERRFHGLIVGRVVEEDDDSARDGGTSPP
jgi:hypothetical protein